MDNTLFSKLVIGNNVEIVIIVPITLNTSGFLFMRMSFPEED